MATDLISSPSPPDLRQHQHQPWDARDAHDYSSYAGSFGSASEWGQNDNDGAPGMRAFGQDDGGGGGGYNPTDFDASPPDYTSSSSANLSFFDHENLQPDVLADLDMQPGADQQQFISLSFTPAEPFHKHHHPPSPFVNPSDLSSPGSSPGSHHADPPARHSRQSSVASHHSPRPNFATTSTSPPTSPPEINAASPPALVIPSSEPTRPSNQHSLSHSHLLPVSAGIDINIVPSTPISPGATGASVPFQTVLQNLNAAAQANTPAAAGASAPSEDRHRTPVALPAALAGSPRAPPANIMESASPQMTMWNVSPHGSPMPGRPGLYLRNSSDEHTRISQSHSLHGSPNLPPASFPRGTDLASGLVNLSLGLNGGAQPFASPQQNSNDMFLAAQLRHHRSRSDTSMHPPNWGPHAPHEQPNQMFPSPELGFGGLGLSGMPSSGMPNFPGAYQTQGGPASSFSQMGFDMGPSSIGSQMGGALPPFKMGPPHAFDDGTDNMLLPGIRRSRSDGHRRGVRSEDFSAYGLPTPGLDGNDLLRSITTPDGSLAPNDPRVSPNMRRRGSSRGSHERGSSISSGRPSPYPSPNASPRHLEEMLPANGALDASVTRPHVTTPATAVASNSRRKTEANFVCPVPGCGSTFTRHFNLKGHLRSHNEERPFKCKWPGCEKGFARQHDCKRHEALHLNIRPYNCDGCGKTFARMDALNRHLRSEGGVECRRLGDDDGDVNMSALDHMNVVGGGLQPMSLNGGLHDGGDWTHNGGLVL